MDQGVASLEKPGRRTYPMHHRAGGSGGPRGSGASGASGASGIGICAGFSLIEMLVALVVFALAVLGLLNLAGESTRTAVAIEEHVMAAVVADNVAVEAAILDVRTLAGEARGSEEAGGRDWRWTRSTGPTADPSLLRVDIRVSPPGESRVAAEISLFRSAPQ